MFINLNDVDAGQQYNSILNYVVCIDKESTSAGLYRGMLLVVDTFTLPYAHLLYMGCGKGRYVNGEPMYKGSGRGWGGIGNWSI